MKPLVSICLPNYQNREFLPDRINSILCQSIADWELVIFDNYSTDGAWEYLFEQAKTEPRIRLQRAPRTGMYANWNNCIKAAQGQYIYIATSDDTMASDCLEKLSNALSGHPQCGLAHCTLRILGEDIDSVQEWWNKKSPISKSLGGTCDISHLRKAPIDGLLHLAGRSVILSITQTLVRRDVFERVGYFREDCGSIADFEWHARCALIYDSIFLHDTWGGWRIHPKQATALNSGSVKDKLCVNRALFKDALSVASSIQQGNIPPSLKSNCTFLAYAHGVYDSSRGQNPAYRVIRIVAAMARTEALYIVLAWGIRKLVTYIKDPEQYVLDELAGRYVVPIQARKIQQTI